MRGCERRPSIPFLKRKPQAFQEVTLAAELAIHKLKLKLACNPPLIEWFCATGALRFQITIKRPIAPRSAKVNSSVGTGSGVYLVAHDRWSDFAISELARDELINPVAANPEKRADEAENKAKN